VKIRDRAAAKMASGLSDVMLHGCLMLEATVHRVSDERTWGKLAGVARHTSRAGDAGPRRNGKACA
jgi:hypothetical protein